MNIWSLSLYNIKAKPLYTFLSIVTLSLSIALLLGVQQLKNSFLNQIENNLGNIDVVIGAKGSPLQLVLSSVLHIDNPTGNISYAKAEKIAHNPRVKKAIPISIGDNYKGHRIIGTNDNFIGLYDAVIESGRFVEKSMEIVLGSKVAKKHQLSIGDHLESSHGLVKSNATDTHDAHYTVVGVLKPSQKIINELLLTSLESVWEIHEREDHEEHDSHTSHDSDIAIEDHEHEAEKEITALLVAFKSPRSVLTFPRKINKDTNFQAVLPTYELHKLLDYTSVGLKTISWIAYIILLIACVSIFVNLYKMVKDRAYDLAILRSYGASSFQLIKMLFYEAGLIALFSLIFGYLLNTVALVVLSKFIDESAQGRILINIPISDLLQTSFLIYVAVILSVVLAIIPILKMNISTILSNEK